MWTAFKADRGLHSAWAALLRHSRCSSAVVQTVLNDGVLTQEEKRLIITIGRELELDDGDPVRVYNAVLEGEIVTGGRKLTRNERGISISKIVENCQFQ